MVADGVDELTMLCLANSWRPGGNCVAGKEFAGGKPSRWVRPISSRTGHEVSNAELVYAGGQKVGVLDIVSVPVLEPRPMEHQSENWIFDSNVRWKKLGRATWSDIVAATDRVRGVIFDHDEDSYHGVNDKVPEAAARRLPSSLALIEPVQLELVVGSESRPQKNDIRRVRAGFNYNRFAYKLVVTDPWISSRYLAGQDGSYPVADSRICVSLTEINRGIATKLAAAIITPDRVS